VFTELCAVNPTEEQTGLSIGKGRTLAWHDICPSRKWMVIILLTQWEGCVGKWCCRLRRRVEKPFIEGGTEELRRQVSGKENTGIQTHQS
jgi:hypothetical protein